MFTIKIRSAALHRLITSTEHEQNASITRVVLVFAVLADEGPHSARWLVSPRVLCVSISYWADFLKLPNIARGWYVLMYGPGHFSTFLPVFSFVLHSLWTTLNALQAKLYRTFLWVYVIPEPYCQAFRFGIRRPVPFELTDCGSANLQKSPTM